MLNLCVMLINVICSGQCHSVYNDETPRERSNGLFTITEIDTDPCPGTGPCPKNGYRSHLGMGVRPLFVCSLNIFIVQTIPERIPPHTDPNPHLSPFM